ncbi:hypothetical protein OG879_31415 [Streptomyces caniferus]|uniref:hypothetical protein n=1 Tax=Streptomyces caniferus TaxID=285557 RepID=UPI002E2BD34F|nr:hypothetical protein [Streptomyces caniferus]
MASTVWYQDGVSYLGADMARFNALWVGDSNGAHLFPDTVDFTTSNNQTDRTVTVNPGRVYVYSSGGYECAQVTTGTVLDVAAPSTLNPRLDLVVVRVATGGQAVVEILTGTPAATPVAPARPAKSVAVATVLVPKATTTFTVTATRYTGQYADQLLAPSAGRFATKWASGSKPSPAGFRVGAVLHELTYNQRWVKNDAGAWFTTDPGPWRTVALKNFDADGTAITTTGTLYARESSTEWEFSGQATFSPSVDYTTLNRFATVPSTIDYPTQNTYGASGQTYGSTATSGLVRFGFMTTGELEIQSDGVISNLYVNVRLSKSPWNS